MIIKPYLLPVLIGCSLTAFAGASSTLDKNAPTKPLFSKDMFSHLSLNALGSYSDFTFKSEAGGNYNKFNGYSKLISVGGNNIVFTPTIAVGVSIFKSQTNIGSNVYLAPGLPSSIAQTTRSNTLFGHVMKALKPNLLIDLAAAYAWNRVDTTSILAPGPRGQLGFSANNSSNWFASLSGLYSRPWNRFLVSTNARLLYSEVNTGSYLFYTTTSDIPPQTVKPLTNQSWYLMENIELGYKLQAYPQWMPFANTGLVQVLSFHNSRPSIGIPISGAAPQLDLNKNGVHFGAGLNYTKKQFNMRLEQQFYSAGRTYYSLQTLLGVSYALS